MCLSVCFIILISIWSCLFFCHILQRFLRCAFCSRSSLQTTLSSFYILILCDLLVVIVVRRELLQQIVCIVRLHWWVRPFFSLFFCWIRRRLRRLCICVFFCFRKTFCRPKDWIGTRSRRTWTTFVCVGLQQDKTEVNKSKLWKWMMFSLGHFLSPLSVSVFFIILLLHIRFHSFSNAQCILWIECTGIQQSFVFFAFRLLPSSS